MSEVDGLMGSRRDGRYELGYILSAGHRQVLRWRITAVDMLDTVTLDSFILYFVISVWQLFFHLVMYLILQLKHCKI